MKKYGLIGYPLGHSFSRQFFTHKFAEEAVDAEYVNFELPDISFFPDVLKQNPNLCGLNVTIPYKEAIIPFLDDLDEEARQIGAVNVIKIDKATNRLKGYNSDIIGFQNSIAPLIDRQIHKRALVLGTGGASKAVVKGLYNLGIESECVSRSVSKAGLTYEQLSAEVIADTIIVNTTPLGTYPNVDDAPDIPYKLLTKKHLLYDLVYNPAETTFLRLGRERGALTKNGYKMLELQAIASWEIWHQ